MSKLLTRILVTCADGFVGKNMAAALKLNPLYVVEQWNWNVDPLNRPDVKGYNWVVHPGLSEYEVNSLSDSSADLEFSKWLLTECQHYGVHLQFGSSAQVYGTIPLMNEYAECKPETAYAAAKLEFDTWAFAQPHTAYVQGFRYFTLYGKWHHFNGKFNQMHVWEDEATRNKKITVSSAHHTTRLDWTWVGDVCNLQSDFILKVKGSGLWNAGSGLAHRNVDVAEEIARARNVPFYVDDNEPHYHKHKQCADLTHLKRTIGKRKWLNVYEWVALS